HPFRAGRTRLAEVDLEREITDRPMAKPHGLDCTEPDEVPQHLRADAQQGAHLVRREEFVRPNLLAFGLATTAQDSRQVLSDLARMADAQADHGAARRAQRAAACLDDSRTRSLTAVNVAATFCFSACRTRPSCAGHLDKAHAAPPWSVFGCSSRSCSSSRAMNATIRSRRPESSTRSTAAAALSANSLARRKRVGSSGGGSALRFASA